MIEIGFITTKGTMELELVQPGLFSEYCEIKESKLVFKKEPSLKEWCKLAEDMIKGAVAWQWAIGDVLRYGVEKFGEEAYQVFDPENPKALKTVKNALRVCDKIEPSRRRGELSFSHHEAVAGFDPETQDELLAEAVNDHLSVQALRVLADEKKEKQKRKKKKASPKNDKPSAYTVNDEVDALESAKEIIAWFDRQEEESKLREWSKTRKDQWKPIIDAIRSIGRRMNYK